MISLKKFFFFILFSLSPPPSGEELFFLFFTARKYFMFKRVPAVIHTAENVQSSYVKFLLRLQANPSYAEDKERQRGYNDVLDSKSTIGSTTDSSSDLDAKSVTVGTPQAAAAPSAPAGAAAASSKECTPTQRQATGDRMLDWFSVVMNESWRRRSHGPRSRVHFQWTCKPEVRWMFNHLDRDADGSLSLYELYGLEHDPSEKCMKPILESCDANE